MSPEMAPLVEAFGYTWADLQWFTINAMKSSFIPFDERLVLINDGDQAGIRLGDGAAGHDAALGGNRHAVARPHQPSRPQVTYEVRYFTCYENSGFSVAAAAPVTSPG